MSAKIEAWEIVGGQLKSVKSSLAEEGRTESLDLERWIMSDPSIVRSGLRVLGNQVRTDSGPLDILAIDESGNLVIIELKRDLLPREALVQAIDYASDIASWDVARIGEVCLRHRKESLEDILGEMFPDEGDLEHLIINETQRIILVGFSIEPGLERMIEWLSEGYGVSINAVSLKYIRTSSGNEILTRTSMINEQVEEARTQKKKISVPMSDEPGDYEVEQLKELLFSYLSQSLITAQRMRDVFFPACLARDRITREELKQEFVRLGNLNDPSKVGYVISLISVQIGLQKNDFLRQLVGYEYPNYKWEKDNYFIRQEYRELIVDILARLETEI